MKKILLTAIFLSGLLATAIAQEKTNVNSHQIGITFNNLNSFGINYKYGTEKIRLRASVLGIGGYNEKMYGRDQDSLEDKQNSLSAGLKFGFEKTIPLYKNFFFIWGLELQGSYGSYKHEIPGNNYSAVYKTSRFVTGINAIAGIEYVLDNHWVFGAELAPEVLYTYEKTKRESPTTTIQETTTHNVSFNITNNTAALSIAFRF